MPKLSENQQAAVDALRADLASKGVSAADKTAWKKAAPDGVSVNVGSLLKAGAITATQMQIGGRTVEVYAPKEAPRPTAEIGG